jgi:hypothetical protein
MRGAEIVPRNGVFDSDHYPPGNRTIRAKMTCETPAIPGFDEAAFRFTAPASLRSMAEESAPRLAPEMAGVNRADAFHFQCQCSGGRCFGLGTRCRAPQHMRSNPGAMNSGAQGGHARA